MQTFVVEASRTAALTVAYRDADGTVRRLHSRYDPEQEAAEMVAGFPFDGNGLLVILGLGLGYHVAEFRQRYPCADIVVVEALKEMQLLCGDYGTAPEASDRLRFLVGFPPEDVVAEVLRRHRNAGLPPLAVFTLASEAAVLPDYYGAVRRALEPTLSFRLWERLRYPKFRSDALTVALFDFGYFLTEEIARALRALGHDVVRVRGRKEETCGDILGRAVETIASDRPDFFLTVNHLGFDEEGALAELFRAIEMPAAIWYVDSPDLVVRAFPKNVSPYSAVFVWDKGYLGNMKSVGFENVAYLPLGADETVFRPGVASAAGRRKFGADVGFVGNSMITPARERLETVPEPLRAAVEKLAQALCMSRRAPLVDTIAECLNGEERAAWGALGPKDRSGFEAAVLWRATLLYRLSCLRALEPFRPCVRGDEGWRTLLSGDFRIGPQLNYYKELPSFYNACKVNFNATSVQMASAVNQRVFDVPACGAFLLTDRQEAIDGLFDPGKEIVTYRDPGEVPDLVRFFLRDGSAREAIGRKGRDRVLREHTYRHRIGTILDRMRELYG